MRWNFHDKVVVKKKFILVEGEGGGGGGERERGTFTNKATPPCRQLAIQYFLTHFSFYNFSFTEKH